jgi:L-malate glycosyltransferase
VNILFCTLAYYPGITGGAERQARLQAEDLVRRRHRVTVVCARTDNLPSATINGVHVVRLRRINRRPVFRLSYMARLLAWLVRNCGSFDVVHVHLANLQADIAVVVAHRRGRPAYVKVACGGAVGEVHRFKEMAKLTRWYGLRHADRVQVLSDEIRSELASIGVPPAHIVEIPNGIDLDVFRPLAADAQRRLRIRLGLPERDLIVLFLGRWVHYKGIDDLLGAWPLVRADKARLVIVGATAEQPQSALPGVTVRSWVQSSLAYLQAADVFVHPSHADGMSNAVLEAMACGCALVATDHGATNRFLTGGQDALLVPVRSSAALAAALVRVITDGELRTRLADNARESVRRYALGDVVDRIEAEYRTMLAASRSPAIDPQNDSRPPADMAAAGTVGVDR